MLSVFRADKECLASDGAWELIRGPKDLSLGSFTVVNHWVPPSLLCQRFKEPRMTGCKAARLVGHFLSEMRLE